MTQNCWFRLFTTILGIVVTDCWKAYIYYYPMKSQRACKNIFDFADCLAYELLNNHISKEFYGGAEIETSCRKRKLASPRRSNEQEGGPDNFPNTHVVVNNSTEVSSPSPITMQATTRTMTPRSLWNHFKKLHSLQKIDNKNKDGHTKRKICRECRKQTTTECAKCNLPICKDSQGGRCDYCHSKHIHGKHPDVGLSKPWEE